MLLHVVERDALLRIEHKQPLDQILCFGAYESWDSELSSRNLPLRHDRRILERGFSDQELVR